jgi:WD40 repeat protein
VRLSPDDALVVVGCSGGTAQVVDRHGTERLRLLHQAQLDGGGRPRSPGDVHAVAFSPDGHWIATGADDGLLRLFGSNGQVAGAFPHPRAVLDVLFRADGRVLASCAGDGAARLWNARGELGARLNHGSPVTSAAFTPGGLLVTGGSDGRARVWRDDEHLEGWTGAGGPVTAVACRPGRPAAIATAHADHTVVVWTENPGEHLD